MTGKRTKYLGDFKTKVAQEASRHRGAIDPSPMSRRAK